MRLHPTGNPPPPLNPALSNTVLFFFTLGKNKLADCSSQKDPILLTSHPPLMGLFIIYLITPAPRPKRNIA